LRRFVDPATPELRSDPREVRDMVIAARSTWLVAFDNVSRVPDWLSDALCRLATGGGWATRELYTDADEVLFEAKRPVLLNGITDFIVRDDLRERTISVVLPAIAEEERREERALWAEFEEASPGIFAALLDYLAGAIRAPPSVNLDRLPRMADFATWAVAAERGAGLADGGSSPFLAAYEEGRAAAREAAIEGSAVGPFLVQFLRARGHWTATAGGARGPWAHPPRRKRRGRHRPLRPHRPRRVRGGPLARTKRTLARTKRMGVFARIVRVRPRASPHPIFVRAGKGPVRTEGIRLVATRLAPRPMRTKR